MTRARAAAIRAASAARTAVSALIALVALAASVPLDTAVGVTGWAAVAWAQPAELPLTVVTISGQVEVYLKTRNSWAPGKLRDQILAGEGARALPGGRLTLRSVGGHSLRLAPLSQLFVGETPPATGQPLALRMDGGWVWAAVLPGVSLRAPLEIQAGPVTVAVRGGAASIRAGSDGTVLVRAHHGSPLCSGAAAGRPWERALKPGEELLVPASGPPGEPRSLTRDGGEAAWVLWNEEQDRAGGYR